MQTVNLDIISDVSCPWCIVGYKSLQIALDSLGENVTANVTWHPFELNPNMPQEGQEIIEHITEKYGISADQYEQNKAALHQRGLDVGYEFGVRGGGRIYNTFDAHRLLFWAKSFHKQTELKLALFDLYFQQKGNPSDHAQLVEVAEKVGLPAEEARSILSSEQFSQEVRQEQQQNQQMGIQSVPAVILNQKYLVSGGQPPEVFENAIKQAMAQA